MFGQSEYERIYTGSFINIQYLRSLLHERGIQSVIRDEMQSGLMAGFGGGVPNHIQLFVKRADLEEVAAIIRQNLIV